MILLKIKVGQIACSFILLTSIINGSNGKLSLKKICETGVPVGSNHTLEYAGNQLECARACAANTNCSSMSFHGNDCVMYRDDTACGTSDGATRDVFKVDPKCELGWSRFKGACYLLVQDEMIWVDTYHECRNRDSFPVTIDTANEGEFLTQLLHSQNMFNTTMWTGGVYHNGVWLWLSLEPWANMYQDWADGEPDKFENHEEQCVAINSDDGKWKTEDRLQYKIAVCEKSL